MVLFYANRPGEPGIVLWEVAIAALCFEALYRSFGVAFRRLACMKGVALDKKRRPTFARDGNSYAVSFVHATIVVVRGFQHLIQQYGAPLEAKFVQQPYGSSNAWAAGAAAIEPTNTIFLAFLAYDVSHVLLEYPRLGGVDVVAHHALFAAASYVCGSNSLPVWKSTSELGSATTSRRWPENSTPSSRCSYGDKWGGPKFDLHTGVFPWPFAWLIIGELSTLPLNLRWTNSAFAATFFLGRVVVYGLGLLHLWRSWHPHVEEACLRVPGLRFVCALFVAGYGLNLAWFRRIVRVATRPARAADD